MPRNLYILAITLGLFALISTGMSLIPISFQPGLPANAIQWRTIAALLAFGALASALLGTLTRLFEQAERRNSAPRNKKLK